MERIGIAASKISKGNFLLYNLSVILISFLFSVFIFFVAGSSIVLALMTIAFVVNGIMPLEFENNWQSTLKMCMITLTFIVGVFNLLAILKNIRFTKQHSKIK